MKSTSITALFALFLLVGCDSSSSGSSSSDSGSSSDSNSDSTTTQATDFVAETTLLSYDFEGTTHNWDSYGTSSSLNSSIQRSGDSSLQVSNRTSAWFGSMYDLHTAGEALYPLEADTTYILRGYIRQQDASASNNYNLDRLTTAEDQNDDGVRLNRVHLDDDQWTLFRGYLSTYDGLLDDGVTLRLNSDNNGNFFLDDISVSQTRYEPDNSGTPLKIQGTQLVNAEGEVVQLQGINLIAYGDETDDSGQPAVFSNFNTYSYFNYDRQDFHDIKAMGFNSIRLALWYRAFEEDSAPGVWLESGFDWLDIVLGWAKEAGLYVVLDMHAPPGGGFQGPNNVTDFWRDSSVYDGDYSDCAATAYRCRYIHLWEELARRYHNDPVIAAYDLLNEPNPDVQSEYPELMKATIDAIRKIDTTRPLMIEHSFNDAAEVSNFLLKNDQGEDYDDQLIYDIHIYDPWSEFTAHATSVYDQDVDDTALQNAMSEFQVIYNNYPFHVGEFGQKSDDLQRYQDKNAAGWITDLMDLMDARGIHYHYFAYKGNEFGIFQDENSFAANSPKNQSLIDLLKARLVD